MDEEEKQQDIKYPLNQIYFYLTEGCNLRCRHCWISPKFQYDTHAYASLKLDLFKSIIKQAKPLGLSGVKLTGGEPLLHPNIQEILEFVRLENLGLTVETNGILCTSELAKKIASNKKTPFVAISLDGVDSETHDRIRGIKGSFDAALKGIKNLVEQGLSPQIIMTVMLMNRDQLKDMALLAEIIGAGSVKYNIVQPIARGKDLHDKGDILSIKEFIELGHWVETELSHEVNIPIHFSHPPAFRPLGRIFGESGDGCLSCGILGILGVLGDGSYALCGIGQTVSELIFGNAKNDLLEDVWNKSEILNEIRKGLPKRFTGICSECVMLGRCLGSCLAQNFSIGGSFWAPYWYCDMAMEQGLFPETRRRQ